MKNAGIAKPDKLQTVFSRLVVSARVSGGTLLPAKLRSSLIAFDSLPISITISLVDGRLAADDNEDIRRASSDNAEPLI